ncbi:hypothetical protein NH340_JMT06757 [Sarcoptes scabiei]|nr:hypothetical protein NH340_JMT06757 [Sarcoptes scabiei]
MTRESIQSVSTDADSIADLIHDEDNSSGDKQIQYNAGDIIVTCRPFIHIITDSMQGKLCDLCLRPTTQEYLIACDECNQIKLCQNCRKSTSPSIFKTIHMLECLLLKKYSTILSSASRFFLRVFLRLENPESIPYQAYYHPITKEEITYDDLIPRIILNDGNETDDLCNQIKLCYQKYNQKLENNQTELIEAEGEERISIEEIAILQFMNLLEEFGQCDDLLEYIDDDGKIYRIWKIFVRLWSYAIPIYDESITGLLTLDPIAYGIYLESSVMTEKHSCVPNCSFAHYGPVLQLRAMKTISVGKDFTVNYVDISMPRPERMLELRNYYITDCFCSRCLNQNYDGSLIDLEQFNEIKNEFIQSYNEYFKSFSPKLEPTSHSFTLDFSFSTEEKEKMEDSFEECIKLSDLAKRLNKFYDQIYPFDHPEKSRFLFTFTAIEMNHLLFKLESRDYQESLKAKNRESGSLTTLDNIVMDIDNWSNLLKKSYKSIKWTHGIDHRLFREIPIPLARIWSQAFGGKTLTMKELYADPSILLQILSQSSWGQSNSSQNQYSFLQNHFTKLIPLVKDSQSETVSSNENDRQILWILIRNSLRFVLVLFSLLFPLFVYLTFSFQSND